MSWLGGLGWLRRHIDPFGLKGAARTAIVMPGVFAFADQVIQSTDATLFAAFGSFAVLVLADFGGPWRTRLVAYLAFTAAGAALIAVGTFCSETPWLAVAAMAVVGFAILLSRVISGYFAAASFAAILLFIIPVAFPGSASAVPARIEGWLLAALVGTVAKLTLWPARPLDRLRADAARACRALANVIDPDSSAGPSAVAERPEAARSAVAALRQRFVATPQRPTGPTGPTEALAFLVDALDWLRAMAAPTGGRVPAGFDPCEAENREVLAAAAAVLRDAAANLDGEHRDLALDRLDRARDVVEGALAERVGALAPDREGSALLEAAEPSFRIRQVALSTREIGVNALRASGRAARDWDEPEVLERGRRAAARGRSASRATWALLRAHATPSSASFRNSLRGGVGLAAAVLVVEIATVQHGFWVALATLSVLRSNALGTASTAFTALAGTTVGIVLGGALIYVIGSDETVLWTVLPPVVLLAAYGFRTTFAAGQAGFTMLVLIIFNIIAPAGWEIGLVRVEDVAIGAAISLGVGLLIWPRGVESLVRQCLGAAYARAGEYVAVVARWLVGADGAGPDDAALGSARAAARDAASRLDDAFRQYLAEPSTHHANLETLATLASGSIRVRLTGYSLSTLTPTRCKPPFDRCGEAVDSEAGAVRSWYESFGDVVAGGGSVPQPHLPPEEGSPVVRCVSKSLTVERGTSPDPAVSLLWANQHLDGLWRLGADLRPSATELAGHVPPSRASAT